MPPILYLIDGHALAYRTYFALTSGGTNSSQWTTSKGEPTAAVYGFTSILLRFLEQENPDYIAVAFDVGKTFRDEIFEEYKGTREKMPDDLREQIKRIKQIVDTLNIPRLERKGYEADDVLGSVANWAVKQGLGVKILTGDRDLLQLVNDRIYVNLPGKSISDAKDFHIEDVIEYWGVRPDQVVDLKALMGDSSDNIPGVKGVGIKTASKLLQTYDTLDNIYAHIEEQKGALKTKLVNDKENAYLSQKLAKIIIDLDITMDLEQAKPSIFEFDEIYELFKDLEFNSLIKRIKDLAIKYGHQIDQIPKKQSSKIDITGQTEQLQLFDTPTLDDIEPDLDSPSSTKTTIIKSKNEFENLLNELSLANEIAIDTETTSTDKMQADLVGISLSIKEGEGYYIPVGHKKEQEQLSIESIASKLSKILMDPKKLIIGHNLKFDQVMLKRNNIEISSNVYDTMIASWFLDPGGRSLSLKKLAMSQFGVEMTEITELIGKGKNQTSMDRVSINRAAPYAAADADITFRLYKKTKPELEQQGFANNFYQIEIPLINVLIDMEMEGISVDLSFLGKMSRELAQQIESLKDDIYAVTGEFNLNSTQQLSKVLFEDLKIPPPANAKKTSSGQYSTAAGVLEEIKEKHEVIAWLLDYRELTKLKSTYVDALPDQVNPITKRIHTSYNQVGSTTGRLASLNPNLQNIPIRTEQGRKVRNAFYAQPGNKLLAIDYSQIELRIVAHVAQDKTMIEAFKNSQDIHAITASRVFNKPLEQVTYEERRHAKAINFGIVYGMGAFGLTQTTDFTRAQAQEFINKYFAEFPGIKKYIEQTKEFVKQKGYVELITDRKIYFPAIVDQKNRAMIARIEREAINAPIQGAAADIMKIAMIKAYHALRESGLDAKILLQVHDELVIEVADSHLEKVKALVKLEMENAYKISVPLITDAKSGQNWGLMV
jgi:DNA polymerase-1